MSGVQLLLRWLHIVPAVIAGGAAIHAAIALVPTLSEMPEDVRTAVRDRIAARFRPVVSACVALLLASGLANFVLFQSKLHQGQPLYHGLFGVKFLAAMGVFLLSSALVGRSRTFQPLRDRMGFWVKINALLVVVILLVSGILGLLPTTS